MTVTLVCPHCGFSKEIRRDRILPGIRWARCPSCRERFEIPVEAHARAEGAEAGGEAGSGMGSETGSGARRGAPWERRTELGLWASIYWTIKESLLSPDKLFKGMLYGAGLREPLAFGLLIGSLGSMIGFFWQFLAVALASGWVSFIPLFPAEITVGVIFLTLMAFIPIFVAATLFVYAGMLHVMLRIVGGAKNGFEASFRVICYSQSAQALALVPFVGGWIGGLWQLIVQVIGLREIHETSYLRVFLAFLIPVVCLILLVFAGLIPLFMYLFREAAG